MSSPKAHGATIRIFLVDGTPQGRRLVDRIGWTGVCLAFSRADYGLARQRPELLNTGVYVLAGLDPDGKRSQKIYVGEGDVVRTRVDTHHKEKDFWTHGYVLTSKDGSLNKAHVRYLESRLIEIGHKADSAVIDNLSAPPRPSLIESEIADMEAYLDNALLLLPLVGVTVFEIVSTDATASPGDGSSIPLGGTRYMFKGHLISAEAVDDPRGFTVLEGALGRRETKIMTKGYEILRTKLIEEGILLPHNDKQLRLTKNYVFDSPSSAASVLAGGSKNGRVEWIDASGLTLKQNQEAAAS